MMQKNVAPVIRRLLSEGCIGEGDILGTADGFVTVYKSLCDILGEKGILDFPDISGARLACSSFYDDWFVYTVSNGQEEVCSLVKLREQEFDAQDGQCADGDTPGVTVSFIAFRTEILLRCLEEPSDENRQKLDGEINRVVARRGQLHHPLLKRYFRDPGAQGPYLIASLYTRYIAGFSQDGYLPLPECYRDILQQSISYKRSARLARLPSFIASVNEMAGRVICDGEKIHIRDKHNPTEYECLAILATHTGNTSVHSFAAEVEYHARFLIPLARLRIPFFGKSIYESAIRADMTVGDTEFEGPAPFYQPESRIVKRQRALHGDFQLHKGA